MTRAHVFPPVMQKQWRVDGGRVQTRSLEAHVVDHCNLRCAGCCSLSPHLPTWFADVDDVGRDLAAARRVLAPQVFKLVGGEPTLHPHLTALVEVARNSGIAPRVSVTTNGLLLPKLDDAFFAAVDALTISLYPTPALPQTSIDDITARARAFNVALNWKTQDSFVAMDRDAACSDDHENARVFDQCWLRERCHLMRDGVFFQCTRPPHFASLVGGAAAAAFAGDGLRLDDNVDAAAVVAYLERKDPLAACALCHGGSSTQQPHRQLGKDETTTATQQLQARALRVLP